MGQIHLPPSPPRSSLPSSSVPIDLPDELPPYEQVADPYRDDLSPAPETAYYIPGQQSWHSIRQKQRTAGSVTLDPTLSSLATTLEDFIDQQTRLPPRPCLLVNGTHRESRKSGNETKTETVTDFDFRIDLTRTILHWKRDERPTERWSYTTVVSDFDGQKAYRGGRWPTRTRNPGRIVLPDGDGEGERLMDLERGEDIPGIKGWCDRFCSDPAPVKSFTYRRSLHGFDAAPMRTALTSHIRATGYQGHISITPAFANGVVTIYSPHWINTLRNNKLVYWACIILQLWILIWPVIFFMERRYEVIRSEWFSSQSISDPAQPGGSRKVYAGGHDEATAAELWAPVVREAAWQGKCHGEFLGEAEIKELRRQGTERQDRAGQGSELVSRGQAVLGMMGIRSIGGVNVSGGWGGDTSNSSGSRFSIRMG